MAHYRPWHLVIVLGWVLGFYGWELWAYNVDFTGPHAMGWGSALILILLGGPALLLTCWILYSLAVYLAIALCQANRTVSSKGDELSLLSILARDAWTYLPLSIFILSPLFYLLLGRHSTEYQAAVVVLVSLSVSGVATLKAWALHDTLRGAFSVSEQFCRRLVWAMVGLYVVTCSTLVVLRYNAYNVWGVDLGLLDQALWNTLHGRFMQITYYGGAQTTLFAFHFEPICLLLLPLYAIWADPRLLFIIQAAVVGLGAIPLYELARQKLGSDWAAVCFALGYLVFPSVVSAGLDSSGSLRSDTLALPILLLTLYYLERGHKRRFLAAALLALACKEYIALVVGLLGLYILYRKRDVHLGLVTLGMAATWFVAVMWGVIPYFRGGEESFYYQLHFSHLGGEAGLVGILKGVIGNPMQVLTPIFTRSKLIFLFFLLFSAGLLPLLNLPTLLVSAPIFGIFFLRQGDHPISLGNFHFFTALPFILLAAIEGADFLRRKGVCFLEGAGRVGRSFLRARLANSISTFFLTSCFLAGFFWGPSPLSWTFWSPGRPFTYWRNEYVPDDHDRRANQFVDTVPARVPVIASDYLLSRLSQRQMVYSLFAPPPDEALAEVGYAVIDLFERHVRTPETREREMALLQSLLRSDEFTLVAYEDGLLFLERGRDASDDYYTSAGVVANPWPQHEVNLALGNRLLLLGYDFGEDALQRGGKHRITYYWQVLEGFDRPFTLQHAANPDSTETLNTNWVLIDTFSQGKVQFRVIHLPTHILLPPDQWQPGQIVREVYDFVLPEDLPAGEYDWQVGLYAVPGWFAIETEPSRLVPGTETLHLTRTRV